MNCKVSRPSKSDGSCAVLDFASAEIKFRQMFYIRFCTKCHWNFGGFLKIHITFYKHTFKISNGNNVQQNYQSIEPLLNFLAVFFIEEIRFLSIFFQIQNWGWGYTGGKLKLEAKVSLCTHFWGYLYEKLIFS